MPLRFKRFRNNRLNLPDLRERLHDQIPDGCRRGGRIVDAWRIDYSGGASLRAVAAAFALTVAVAAGRLLVALPAGRERPSRAVVIAVAAAGGDIESRNVGHAL